MSMLTNTCSDWHLCRTCVWITISYVFRFNSTKLFGPLFDRSDPTVHVYRRLKSKCFYWGDMTYTWSKLTRCCLPRRDKLMFACYGQVLAAWSQLRTQSLQPWVVFLSKWSRLFWCALILIPMLYFALKESTSFGVTKQCINRTSIVLRKHCTVHDAYEKISLWLADARDICLPSSSCTVGIIRSIPDCRLQHLRSSRRMSIQCTCEPGWRLCCSKRGMRGGQHHHSIRHNPHNVIWHPDDSTFCFDEMKNVCKHVCSDTFLSKEWNISWIMQLEEF